VEAIGESDVGVAIGNLTDVRGHGIILLS
jgi:hypothetical protein